MTGGKLMVASKSHQRANLPIKENVNHEVDNNVKHFQESECDIRNDETINLVKKNYEAPMTNYAERSRNKLAKLKNVQRKLLIDDVTHEEASERDSVKDMCENNSDQAVSTKLVRKLRRHKNLFSSSDEYSTGSENDDEQEDESIKSPRVKKHVLSRISWNTVLNNRSAPKLRAWLNNQVNNSGKQRIRQGWTTPAKKRVRQLFGSLIANEKYPSIYEMELALKYPELKGRTVDNIRSFINFKSRSMFRINFLIDIFFIVHL